ncbi:MAG: type II/IV secretion system protein [Planctomycetia bacterium]|nr:type II/IV secretion system protein [Planctomycetia bacterium]
MSNPLPLRQPAAAGDKPSAGPRLRERRRYVRLPPACPCRASIRIGGSAWTGQVRDVSDGGLLVQLTAGQDLSPLSPGLRADVRVSWAGGQSDRSGKLARVQEDTSGACLVGLDTEPQPGDTIPIQLDVRLVKIDPTWALRVPAPLALRRQILPLCLVDGRVHVACADPGDASALQALERYIDRPLQPWLAEPDALREVLRRVYADANATPDQDDPVALCNELLYAAWIRQASDIHVDAEKTEVRIRLRVDGQLEDYRRLPIKVHGELLTRIKVLAGMDIAEKRSAQDGRFTHAFGKEAEVDIRVATLPTKHGERASLRLLAMNMASLTLENLGMDAGDLGRFEREIDRPHGLLLATGPTGCGKTTTFYAALRRIIARRSVNAIAVLDPVEYDIPGVAQVEVDSAQKVTFAGALRSILRHDPDVIMIGEIRDQETVDIAIKAALTGHLVLATLHTNSAASVVTRLADMGVDRYLIGATLGLVVSQRLVRRLCPHCARPSRLAPGEAVALGRPEAAGLAVFEPGGCVHCAGRGFSGRVGLFEFLSLDAELSTEVARGADEPRLVELARRRGLPDIRDDALRKLSSGITTVREALAAVSL